MSALFPRFKEAGLGLGLAENLKGALEYIKKNKPCLVFSRPVLPGFKAEELLESSRENAGFPPIIIFTDQGSARDAEEFLSLGAKDYWLEPLAWDKIKAVLPREEEAASRAAPPRPKSSPGVQIIGDHSSVRRILALAKQVAPSKAAVLISGESGTGKELIAKFLHQQSDRADKPFVAVNCAALPEHLLESELFGHEKGSFTGAISRKLGKFELADHGTILLDEISEMDMGLQAKLLRVLQENELDRVGGVETVKVDVRVLATTNRDIKETVEKKEFRGDLYFRLNVIPLKLPPLRERGADTSLLARYFVDNFCRAYGLPRLTFSSEAEIWLGEYDWPGNVRELQNLMERAVLLAQKGPIEKRHFLLDGDSWPLPDEAVAQAAGPDAPAESGPDKLGSVESGPDEMEKSLEALMVGDMPLKDLERIIILKRLKQTLGNRTQAAELLGISVRTLRNKLNEYRKLDVEIPGDRE
ncbi:MAG: sigma-54 dependent transcriptional regulator [Thermodesulfobacteriota bacterium]|nr:sigma-54 dependent transcriptional regulator [Thermodesulfobacteriota bacterium]